MHKHWVLNVCFAIVLIASPVFAEPVPDALRIELCDLAKDIKSIVDKHGGGVVAVGAFTSSADVQGHVGPRVQKVLAEELEKQKLTVSSKGFQFEITGKYLPFEDTVQNRLELAENDKERKDAQKATGLQAVRLVALLSRSNGKILNELPTGRLIFGAVTVPEMIGVNTSTPPLRDPRDVSKNIQEAMKSPQIELKNTRIQGRTRQFAIELLVKQGGGYVAQPVTMQDGNPFVGLKNSDIYGVRLINDSSHEAAVDLSIDGINSFAFSDRPSQYWIIPAGQSVDVLGWHRNENVTTEFKVVANFPETAAAQLNLKPSETIGLITASFSACWEKDDQRPSDETDPQGRGTGFGSDIDFKTEKVSRKIGQARDTLNVRYEK